MSKLHALLLFLSSCAGGVPTLTPPDASECERCACVDEDGFLFAPICGKESPDDPGTPICPPDKTLECEP